MHKKGKLKSEKSRNDTTISRKMMRHCSTGFSTMFDDVSVKYLD